MLAYRPLLLKLLSALIFFGAWEIAGRIPVSYAFPTFLESMGALWTMALDGTLWTAYAETLKPLIVGVAISTVLGIALGLWIGLSKFFDWLVSPIFMGRGGTSAVSVSGGSGGFSPVTRAWTRASTWSWL